MNRSTKVAAGLALVSIMGLARGEWRTTAQAATTAGGAGRAARTAPSAACAAPLPTNRVLPTEGGIQTYTTLGGGGYVFNLNQYGPQGLDAMVQHFFGITLPPGDAVATWSLTLPGGRRYFGVAHVFPQGVGQRVCLQGTAYLNLGNGSVAVQAQAVTVFLNGTVDATRSQVDLRVNGVLSTVYGRPHVRQGCRLSAGTLIC